MAASVRQASHRLAALLTLVAALALGPVIAAGAAAGRPTRRAPVLALTGGAQVRTRAATVHGTVDGRQLARLAAAFVRSHRPRSRPLTIGVYFQYGTSAAYRWRSARRPLAGRSAKLMVSASLTRLTPGTAYHYRVVATYPGGSVYGADRVFKTPTGSPAAAATPAASSAPSAGSPAASASAAAAPAPSTASSAQRAAAGRALATYQAMQAYFYAANAYPADHSSLYVGSYPPSGRQYSYLWPFTRALVGTITLSGVPAALLPGSNFAGDATDRLVGLSRYADTQGYESYPTAGGGGDKYYDDQAWVGLALAEDYELNARPSSLTAAAGAFDFVYPAGWDASATFDPGGTFWVQQGVGVGKTNHDRTATANAPNAELGFRLETLDRAHAPTYDAGAQAMYGWVNHYLYNVQSNPTDPRAPNPNYDSSQPALVFDKAAETSITKARWTYNQGAAIAANVAAYRDTHITSYLADAVAIATTALDTFNEGDYISTQPAAFDAIFFRGLLQLYGVSPDAALRSRILQTIQAYSDDAWNNHRDAHGLFRFPSSGGSGDQLLDQGAMLQIYAALAWNPDAYPKLP
jgi:glycosyl hydrolase family 76